jgi:hypothetical protein
MTSEWNKKFPRLIELRERDQSKRLSGFFDAIPQNVNQPQFAVEFYRQIEKDLQTLDDIAWQYLQNEILSTALNLDKNPSYSQVITRIFEAKGYVYLINQGYDKIKFIHRQTGQKTPDLMALDEDKILALLEVKTIWESDDEWKYILENTRSLKDGKPLLIRRLQPKFSNELKCKIRSVLRTATDQLTSFSAPSNCRRIVLFVIHLDHEQAMTQGICQDIKKLLESENNFIEIKCCFQGWLSIDIF